MTAALFIAANPFLGEVEMLQQEQNGHRIRAT
jgi:hypothetical protein